MFRFIIKHQMKKISLFCVSFFVLATVFAQNEISEPNVQKRAISSFHAIDASAGVEVIITKGDKEELAVTVGDLSYLDQVKTTVSNGVLKITREIDWKFWKMWSNTSIRVYVSYTTLDKINVSSGSNLKGTSIQLSTLNVKISSGGMVKLSGSVGFLDVSVNSGANFRGSDFVATKCTAEVNSGGEINISVDKELSADASSGGSIKYKGEALIRNINTSSGGSVKRQS